MKEYGGGTLIYQQRRLEKQKIDDNLALAAKEAARK